LEIDVTVYNYNDNSGSQVVISPEATFDEYNDYADTYVIQTASIIGNLNCYPVGRVNTSSPTPIELPDEYVSDPVDITNPNILPIDVPISPVTQIFVLDDNGNEVTVQNLSEPISFDVPIAQTYETIISYATRACRRFPVCTYYDYNTAQWSSDGCSVVNTIDNSGKIVHLSSLYINSTVPYAPNMRLFQ
jgi:hypothetical protein